MKLLFITRKYPPSVGGMEKVSYDLSQEFSKRVPTTIIAWGGSQIWLPWFVAKAFFQSLFFIPTKKITNIHIADGVLSPLGLLLKILTKRKVTVTVHGLDINYKNTLYQAVVPFCLSKLDKVVCISSATLAECVKRGIPESKCTVIPWGVYPDEFKINATRKELEKITGTNLEGKKVLITVGRLVKRKGVAWFIKNVMPKLDNRYIYLVAGDGPERENIQVAIKKLNLDSRVKLLGKISDHEKKILYNTADVFVMPNIKVEGDMEGFGIVAIEATSAGLPVVGSSMEGISDAVLEGKTALLHKTKDIKNAMRNITKASHLSRKTVSDNTLREFSWSKISDRYERIM